MSRFLLALRCFFAVLLRFRLPDDAAKLLPPELKRLPDAHRDAKPETKQDTKADVEKAAPAAKAEPASADKPSAKPESKQDEAKPAVVEPPSGAERDALRQRGEEKVIHRCRR